MKKILMFLVVAVAVVFSSSSIDYATASSVCAKFMADRNAAAVTLNFSIIDDTSKSEIAKLNIFLRGDALKSISLLKDERGDEDDESGIMFSFDPIRTGNDGLEIADEIFSDIVPFEEISSITYVNSVLTVNFVMDDDGF